MDHSKTLRKYRISEKSLELPFDSFQNFYSFAQYPGTRHLPYKTPVTRDYESAHYLGLGGVRRPFQDPSQIPDQKEIHRPTI